MKLTWFGMINWVKLFKIFKMVFRRIILLFWQYLSAVGLVVIWLWILSGTKESILKTILFISLVVFLSVGLIIFSVVFANSLVSWYRKYVTSKK